MSTTLKTISPETLRLFEEQARNQGISPDGYLRQLLAATGEELALKPVVTDEEFEQDMSDFAEGTEDLPTYNGTYSREDIYLDHN